MKKIDLASWNRSSHYNFFKKGHYPHFGICANINVTKLLAFSKKKKISSFLCMVYILSKATNSVKELRLRIDGDDVFEYKSVHPSFTVFNSQEIFNFCMVPYKNNFKSFNVGFDRIVEEAKSKDYLCLDHDNRCDLIYMSCLPWISFTSISHPIIHLQNDSIPRISWGKYFKQRREMYTPVSLQANHALVDGFHMGKFYQNLEQEMAELLKI